MRSRSTAIPVRARRLALLALLGAAPLALLTGCSKHTALTINADLAPFLSADQKQATVAYAAGTVTIELPFTSTSPNPGELVDLTRLGVPASAASSIQHFSLDVAGTVTPTSSLDAGTVSVYIGPSTTGDVFQPSYRVAQVATSGLPAGIATTVSGQVALDASTDASALQRIRSGSFRLGVEIQTGASTGGSADVNLTRLQVGLALPPGWGVP